MLATSSWDAHSISFQKSSPILLRIPPHKAAVDDVPDQIASATKLLPDETIVAGGRSVPSPASSSVSAGSDDSGYATDPLRHGKSKQCHPRRRGPSNFKPPSLPNQQEASLCFVKVLICFSTGLVASIWPFAENGGISLLTFISESLRRSRTSYSTLQVALYYLILLKQHIPPDDLSREQSRGTDKITMQCGRRMFLAALILAGKYLQDKNYSTAAWEKITGLDAPEINKNERLFLHAIDYRLHMTKESFADWNQLVIDICDHNKRIKPLHPLDRGRNSVARLDWDEFVRNLTPAIIHDKDLKEVSLRSLLRESFSISAYEFPIGRNLPFAPGAASLPAPQRRRYLELQLQKAESAVNTATISYGLLTPRPSPGIQPEPLSIAAPFESAERTVGSAPRVPSKPPANLANLPGPSPTRLVQAYDQRSLEETACLHAKFHSEDHGLSPNTKQDNASESVFVAETLLAMAKATAQKRPNSTLSKPRKRQRISFEGSLPHRTRHLVLTGQESSDDVLSDPLSPQLPSRAVNVVQKCLRNDLLEASGPLCRAAASTKEPVHTVTNACSTARQNLDDSKLSQWKPNRMDLEMSRCQESKGRQRADVKRREFRGLNDARCAPTTAPVWCN